MSQVEPLRTRDSDQGVPPSPPVPDGIRLEPLSRYLAEHVRGGDGPLTAEMISGGRSNLTYLLRTPGGQWVLRRPPLGHILPTAHDMGREYRMISALADTEVPVPRPFAFCQDPDVIGAPFYIMEYCRGIVIRDRWPPDYGSEADRGRTSQALVTTLAKLHAVDWQAVGLADFARPGGYVERQLRRLQAQWESSKTQEVPLLEEVWARLSASLPPSPPSTIVHGDLHLHNIMLAEDDPGRIVAVLDWELATIGDPLADLGWMLAFWAQADDSPLRLTARGEGTPATALPGFWSRDQVVQEYARLTGRDLSGLDFYIVLGFYKLAVIAQGIHYRYLGGVTRGSGFDRYESRVPQLAQLALEAAQASSLPALRGSR